MKRVDLGKEVKRWRSEDIISEEQENRILSLYQVSSSDRDRAQHLVYIIAGLCMALGIITIISYNWSNFGQNIQLFIGLVPLFLSAVLCIYTYVKSDNIGFQYFAVLINIGAVMASMALIGQIFHLGGNLYSYCVVVALLILPMFYIFPSWVTLVVFAILTGTATSYHMYYSYENSIPVMSIILIAILFMMTMHISKYKKMKIIPFMHLAVCFSMIQLLRGIGILGFTFLDNTIIVILVLKMYDFILTILYKKSVTDISIVRKVLTVYLIGIAFFFLLLGSTTPDFIQFDTTLFVIVLIGILPSITNIKDRIYCNIDILYTMFCLYLFLCYLNIAIAVDVVIILTLLWYLFISIQKKDYSLGIKVFNGAGLYIIMKFFVWEDNLMLKASVLVIISIILVVTNRIVRSKHNEK